MAEGVAARLGPATRTPARRRKRLGVEARLSKELAVCRAEARGRPADRLCNSRAGFESSCCLHHAPGAVTGWAGVSHPQQLARVWPGYGPREPSIAPARRMRETGLIWNGERRHGMAARRTYLARLRLLVFLAYGSIHRTHLPASRSISCRSRSESPRHHTLAYFGACTLQQLMNMSTFPLFSIFTSLQPASRLTQVHFSHIESKL